MYQPSTNRVLLEVLEAPKERKEGGIVIPDGIAVKEPKGRLAKVIAAGKVSAIDEPVAPPLKAGMTVVIANYGGVEVQMENKTYLVVTYADVLLWEEPSDVKAN